MLWKVKPKQQVSTPSPQRGLEPQEPFEQTITTWDPKGWKNSIINYQKVGHTTKSGRYRE